MVVRWQLGGVCGSVVVDAVCDGAVVEGGDCVGLVVDGVRIACWLTGVVASGR